MREGCPVAQPVALPSLIWRHRLLVSCEGPPVLPLAQTRRWLTHRERRLQSWLQLLLVLVHLR